MRLIVFLIIACVAGIGAASADNSSFQRSCSNVNLLLQEFNVWIQAECKNGNGGINWTEIALPGMHNSNGNLSHDRNPSSSFQRSCHDAWLEWEHGWVNLVAICGDGRGGERQSSIYVDDIHNRNGFLVYGW